MGEAEGNHVTAMWCGPGRTWATCVAKAVANSSEELPWGKSIHCSSSPCCVKSFFVLKVLIAQSCPTLCNTMNCSPPGSFVQWNSPGKNSSVGCHFLLQGIFSTQDKTIGSCVVGRFSTIWAMWCMGRGQNTSINRSLEEADSLPHKWHWGF